MHGASAERTTAASLGAFRVACVCCVRGVVFLEKKKMHESYTKSLFLGGGRGGTLFFKQRPFTFPPSNPNPLCCSYLSVVHGARPVPRVALPCYVAFSWRWQTTQWWRWKPSWTARASAPCPRQAKPSKLKCKVLSKDR